MKKRFCSHGFVKIFVCVIFWGFLLTDCQETVDEKYTTFDDFQVGSFLENDPGRYSEFLKVLKSSGIFDLLNAYGTYTLFAPMNEAMEKYYQEKGISFEQLTAEEIREIAYSHIIPKTIKSIDFPKGVVSYMNLEESFTIFKNPFAGSDCKRSAFFDIQRSYLRNRYGRFDAHDKRFRLCTTIHFN
jgi:hypothetical protein